MRYRYIHILAALFLIIGMGVQFLVSYRLATRHVREQIDLQMRFAQEKLRFHLYDAYEVVGRVKDFMANDMEHPDELLDETRAIVNHYPNIFSCYVSFPEYFMPAEGRWYCPCSCRLRDSIVTTNFGDAAHDYFTREWYLGALESEEAGYWSHPYKDEDYDETIFTYSDDVRDKDGNLVCIIAGDFSVSWLQQLLERYRPFDEAVFALYGSDGDCLAVSGDRLPVTGSRDWIVDRQTLDPIDIDLVMAVPRSYVWESIRLGILLPFGVFLLGIIVVGLLIRRLWRDREESARLELMERDMHIANQIQMGILRRDFPLDNNVAVHADLLPMREVGGDLYDFHREGDDLWFIIGDVSGKGVPAAMFMSATVNLFRAAGRRLDSPKAIMEEMNFVLSDNNPSLTFVTAFIGSLNCRTGRMVYCNAGHLPPLVVDSRQHAVAGIQMEPNIPLGYKGDFCFVEQETVVTKGGTLVLYTDGVTEARNAEHRMLGRKRWEEMVLQGGDLLEAVRTYIGSAEPIDDITLMTIKI